MCTISAKSDGKHFFTLVFPLALIAAVARRGVIGRNNTLLWQLPEDLRRFKALTTGHAVIMGRKTWESLPQALPQRQNIVITRNSDYRATGAEIARSLKEAIRKVTMPEPAFCIGGGEIYQQALEYAAVLYLTEIDANFDGDAFFPDFDKSLWRLIANEPRFSEKDGFSYAFNTYVRQSLLESARQRS
ncbi:MAG: dihydrofolate reductase [Burkholderiales bacterium]|nr:dihydrofolate reductase [Burkholderiales bacterium]